MLTAYASKGIQEKLDQQQEEINMLRSRLEILEGIKLQQNNEILEDLKLDVILEKEDAMYLLKLLSSVLVAGRLNSKNFLYKLIETQLECLLCHDVRQFRFDPKIIHWCLTLQYHGGKKIIDTMRGDRKSVV